MNFSLKAILLAFLLSSISYAEEAPVTDAKITGVEMKQDKDGSYLAIEMMPLIDIGAAAGYATLNGLLEAEAFVGARLNRLLGSENIQIPYGARVRVFLGQNSRWFVEYQRQEIADLGNRYGLLEMPNTFSLGYHFNEERTAFVALGTGSNTHHAWRDEDHAPEKRRGIQLRFGKKFKFNR